MIHVCYGLRDESGKYSKFVGTSIQSLLDNTREEVTIHLIHDSTLTESNREFFVKLVRKFGQYLAFYNIEKLKPNFRDYVLQTMPVLDKLEGIIAALYRLTMPELLPNDVSRVIYFDTDIIVNLDVAELWKIDLENFPIAAVPEYCSMPSDEKRFAPERLGLIDTRDYFNSGVMLLDLNKVRSNSCRSLLENCMKVVKMYSDCGHLDQDALNIIFNKNYLKLPLRFNRILNLTEKILPLNEVGCEIYHYAGAERKPNLNMNDLFNRLWFDFYIQTPFFSPESFGNIASRYDEILEQFRQLDDNRRDLFQKILKASLNRRRIFFVCPNDEATIFGAFGHRDDDIIIDAVRENSPAFMFQIAEKFHDHIVIFICVASKNYPEICRELLTLGLNENEDFFNGLDLITSNRVVYYENSIVRDM